MKYVQQLACLCAVCLCAVCFVVVFNHTDTQELVVEGTPIEGVWSVRVHDSIQLPQNQGLIEDMGIGAAWLQEQFGQLEISFTQKRASSEFRFLARNTMGKFWYSGAAKVTALEADKFEVVFDEQDGVYLQKIQIRVSDDKQLIIDDWSGSPMILEKHTVSQIDDLNSCFGRWTFSPSKTLAYIRKNWSKISNSGVPYEKIVEAARDGAVLLEPGKIKVVAKEGDYSLDWNSDSLVSRYDQLRIEARAAEALSSILMIDRRSSPPSLRLEGPNIVPLVFTK